MLQPEFNGKRTSDSATADAALRDVAQRVRFLGIDPGLNRTGYALIEAGKKRPRLTEGGIIRSTAKLTLAERVFEIGDGLRDLLQQYQPQVLAIEQVFSTPKFPKTAILMAHARGAILYTAATFNIPVVHYTPTQIKLLLTGNGRAGKEQIQRAISLELGLDRLLEPNDVADAAAVALCHFHTRKTRQIVDQARILNSVSTGTTSTADTARPRAVNPPDGTSASAIAGTVSEGFATSTSTKSGSVPPAISGNSPIREDHPAA